MDSSISSYEQSQRSQVQSIAGMFSEQMVILTNGHSETKRAFRTVGQESMEYKVKFTHTKIQFGFMSKITYSHQIVNDLMFDTVGYSGSICDIVLHRKALQTQSDLLLLSKSSKLFFLT